MNARTDNHEMSVICMKKAYLDKYQHNYCGCHRCRGPAEKRKTTMAANKYSSPEELFKDVLNGK